MTEILLPKLKIDFDPTHEIDNTPLRLRDNSLNEKSQIKQYLEDPTFREVWGLVHTVVGYNPRHNGSELPRGCANACVSCFFDDNYLENLPPYINDVQKTTLGNLIANLDDFITASQKRFEKLFDIPVNDNEKRIRISGDIRGDPIMADYPTTQIMVKRIKEGFPNIPIIIDTAANQFVMAPEKWKDVGADLIMVSVDTVINEEAYMVFHGVGKGRFEIAKQNIRNIDEAGIKVGLSYVWGSHPKVPKEIQVKMPSYINDGQSDSVRKDFVKELSLRQIPLERLLCFSIGSDKHFDAIVAADEKYIKLGN